ncbi:MAG TPA: FAD:protein FMN transferase [Steroidobacteraceae bacterium]|nr:FAD:protein FMN transferase [Steroidobacteraceae bacterium]
MARRESMLLRVAVLAFAAFVAGTASAAAAGTTPVPTAPAGAWHQREAAIMGTRIAVELWSKTDAEGEAAIDAVMAEMHRVDVLMSHYKPESQLSQINAHAGAGPVRVDRELFDLIARSLDFSRLTNGAFDITYASVGYLYDYRHHVKPDEAQIEAHLSSVDWRSLELDPTNSTVRFRKPGMRIDLGGFAKGYAVDRSIELLKARGIEHASVSAGGDTRILGDRFGRPWIVGIRHPDDADRVILRIPLENVALSTSGDYERYFDENGVRYHHIIDPRTGHSASKVRSATIIGPTATQTDGLSKTAFVLGPQKALEILAHIPDVDAVFVGPDGKVYYTPGLAPPEKND